MKNKKAFQLNANHPLTDSIEQVWTCEVQVVQVWTSLRGGRDLIRGPLQWTELQNNIKMGLSFKNSFVGSSLFFSFIM